MEANTVRDRLQFRRRSARSSRWTARLPRYAAQALVVVLCLVGLREIVLPEQTPPPPTVPDINVDQAAEDFAVRFARAYLSFDAARPFAHERALAPFLSDSLDSDGGLLQNRGRQEVLWAQVAQNQVSATGGRVIVVAVAVSTQAAPIYLAVPVIRTRSDALQLAAYPSFVGPPTVATDAELPSRDEVESADILAMVRRVVGNYVALREGNLAADLAPDAEISMPTTALRLDAVDEVLWSDGIDSGAVLATVDASDSQGNTYRLTYELTLERKGGRVYAQYIETVPTST